MLKVWCSWINKQMFSSTKLMKYVRNWVANIMLKLFIAQKKTSVKFI